MEKIEKWRKFCKEMTPSKLNIIVLCIGLLGVCLCIDFDLVDGYTYSACGLMLEYNVFYILVWFVYSLIVGILYKRKLKKLKESEVKQENENK